MVMSQARNAVCALQHATSAMEMKEIPNILSVFEKAHILVPLSWEKRGQISNLIKVHHVFLSRKSQLDDLQEGLKSLGVLDLIHQYPNEMYQWMVFPAKTSLTTTQVMSVIDNVDPILPREAETLEYFTRYLTEADSDTLADVLQFATSFRCIPPGGLDPPITISFVDAEQLPEAHTCNRTLELPTGWKHTICSNRQWTWL